MDFEVLKNAVKDVTNVILYSELKGPISDFLHPETKSCICLILYTPDVGHYVAMYGKGRTLYYFDSYSSKYYFGRKDHLSPDLPLPPIILKMTKQNKPLLFESIVSDPNYDYLVYNDYTIQTEKNTCGGWALLRILERALSNALFYKKYKTADSEGKVRRLMQMIVK
jgi:hypothetical protein